MILMRSCERTCDFLVFVLRQSLPESNVPVLKKNMKLFSARYESFIPSHHLVLLYQPTRERRVSSHSSPSYGYPKPSE